MGNNDSGELGAATIGDQVADKFADNCRDKIVIVTGANTGLGFETVKCLASKGATVILACRNINLGEAAVEKIKSTVEDADIMFMQLDLGSKKSIKEFSVKFQSKFKTLDILINNAGVMACPKLLTEDGLEMQFGVNHFGHFYLTILLLPLLIKSGTPDSPSRVVNLSSMGQFLFSPSQGIRFDDINGDESYNSWERYGQSKLCNILFTKELNDRYQSKNVISVAVHPGVITGTELVRHIFTLNNVTGVSKDTLSVLWSLLSTQKLSLISGQRSKSIPEGVSTTLVAALDPKVVPGGYYYDCKLSQGEGLHPKVDDQALAKKLWEFSEALITDSSQGKLKNELKVKMTRVHQSGSKLLVYLAFGIAISYIGYKLQ